MPQRRARLRASAMTDQERERRAAVRERVFRRDGGCMVERLGREAGFEVGRCFGRLQLHERRKASQMEGGYTDENGCAVCSHHNAQLEADADLAAWARSVGLVLRRGDEGPPLLSV